MGKKGGSAPAAPDPYKTAAAESQFNRPDTYGPSGGGVRQGYTDASGNFVQGVAPEGFQSAQSYIESDVERQLREMMEPASLNLTGQVVSSIDTLPGQARVGDRSDVARDLFNKNFSLMKPQFEQENDRLLTNLQARGLPVGGEAFDEAYSQQQTGVNEALSRMAMDANLAAGQEQSRQFTLDSAERGNAISEIVAAFGGGYNPPSNMPSGSAAGVNYSGLVGDKYQADMARYNADQQSASATMGAMGQIGAAMLMKCSVSAKSITASLNTRQASYAIQHMPLFVWNYKPEYSPELAKQPHVGPMAESFHSMTGLGTPKDIDVIDIIGVLTGALQDALQRIEKLEYQLEGKRIQ